MVAYHEHHEDLKKSEYNFRQNFLGLQDSVASYSILAWESYVLRL